MHRSSVGHKRRRSGLLVLLPVALILVITIAATPSVRIACLQSIGRILVADDRLERADVIAISVDADGAGVLEAADLVRAGYSESIAVFSDPPDAVDSEFQRRGVPWHDEAAFSLAQLHALGINNVARIPRTVTGTEQTASALAEWSKNTSPGVIIFVATTDHSRRTRRLLRRTMQNTGTRIIVHGSRYSDFQPDTWWKQRGTVRIAIAEMQKLAFDYIRHPIS
jgi:hypothetical protein